MQNKVDRRKFLKVSALSAGGMLIGFNLFNSCKTGAKPPTDLSKLNYQDFNAFIKIAENGAVTIFSPNPEIGQGVKTSMPMLIAEELGVSWDMVLVEQAGLNTEAFTRQVAGGSQSIRQAWEPLRQTGATARQMLINAGADKLGVSPDNCSLEHGIIKTADGKEIGIGEVVNEAAKLNVPENVELKNPKEFNIIGQDKKNVDGVKIVTGQPLFGLDYKKEGMVYACILRPPFGYILDSFNDAPAREVQGVIDVFRIMDDFITVLAKDTYTAMTASKLINPNWKVKKRGADSNRDNEKMLEGLQKNKFETIVSTGNVDVSFNTADTVIERSYETPYLPHACLEPMNFFAHVTDEFVKLAGPIQTPERSANQVAKTLGRDVNEISLELTRIGGGFGRRLNGNFVVEAAVISNHIKKPVQLVYTREDEMICGLYRPAFNYKVSAAIKDNQVTGFKLRQAGQGGYSKSRAQRFPMGAIKNFRVEKVRISSDITTMAWRAPASNSIAFAEQCFMDEVAESLEKDPVSMCLDLLDNAKGKQGMSYEPERMEGAVKLVAEKSNWGNAPEGTFQGFATYYSHNTYAAEVAEVEMENGVPVIKKVYCAVDCGIVVNPLGAKNQIAGGIIDGIGHAMYGDFPVEDGRPLYQNFDEYRLIRMSETPQVECFFVDSDIEPTGLGEPSLPPAGPAIANAIYAATGVRMTKQPFIQNKEVFS